MTVILTLVGVIAGSLVGVFGVAAAGVRRNAKGLNDRKHAKVALALAIVLIVAVVVLCVAAPLVATGVL